MIIKVPVYQHDDIAKLLDKAIKEHNKLYPPANKDWQDQLRLFIVSYTYEHLMGKTFIHYANFEIEYLSNK